MTREEAKRFLVEHCNPRYPDSDKSQWDEAINLAISALEQSVDVQTDTISRQNAINAVMEEVSDKRTHGFNAGVTRAVNKIKTVPSAQRKGKWIYPTDIKGFGRCPHCKALWDYSLISNPFFKFCPRCGNGENEFVELKGEEDEDS